MVRVEIALMFTGQGSLQEPGIWQGLMESERARQIFKSTEEIMESRFSKLVAEGPIEELMQTKNAQPVIIATSLAALVTAKDFHPEIENCAFAVCGHSAGEIAALAAAEVVDQKTAIYLSSERGRIMQTYGGSGTMVALMTEQAQVQEILARINEGVTELQDLLEAVNLNGPRQTVVSGKTERIESLIIMARASRVAAKILPVPNPFHHSVLMKTAESEFAKVIAETVFKDASIPVILNLTGQPETSGVKIKEILSKQIASPVQWHKSILYLLEQGINTFIEFGPRPSEPQQPILLGLLRGINREAVGIWVGDCQSAQALKF